MNNVIERLNKMFEKIKTKYRLPDNIKYNLLKEFYENTSLKSDKNLIEYGKDKKENLIINHLLDFLIEEIYCGIKKITEKHNLCIAFMKILEFTFFKLNNNKTYFLHNLSNDQSLSYIASLTNNINKIIQYIDDEYEINEKMNNKKIEFIKCENICDIDSQFNDILLIDSSIINSRNVCILSKKINNIVVISFGKKIFQNDTWITYKINQYNICAFIHFNANKI